MRSVIDMEMDEDSRPFLIFIKKYDIIYINKANGEHYETYLYCSRN